MFIGKGFSGIFPLLYSYRHSILTHNIYVINMAVATVSATINGQDYTLTYNSTSGYWESTITAPSQTSGSNNAGVGPGVGSAAAGKGYYPVSILAVDDASNQATCDDTSEGSLGQACRLKVLEKVLPVATITAPTDGAYVNTTTPTITVQATDSGSGVNPASGILQIDTGDDIPITLTGSGTTYTSSYTPTTPLANGEHTLKFTATDYDGNQATITTVTFTIDVLPPSLTVTSPEDNFITNQTTINVVGTTTDVDSPPVTVTITVNGVDQGAVTVGTGGAFTKQVSLVNGSNSIVVTATDSSGQSTSVTRTGTVSTSAPIIEEVKIVPNPADAGNTFVLSVKVTDTE